MEEAPMSVQLAAITVDCRDAEVVAEFWSAALGRPVDPGASAAFASIGMPGHRDTTGWVVTAADGPTWLFAQVPEPKPGKNRVHLDLAARDPAAEVSRLVARGATRIAEVEEWGYRWTVLQDPEGNEFCVAQLR
jgi:predicted enzyme related to lactoylglutathione lyase